MEYRHFSHTHGLVFHQLHSGSEIQCSGCKTSGSGNVYVCWQCGYFLHERCYRATRSLKNPSHPLHPLTLMPYPTHESNTFFCNSCNLAGNGLSYCCAQCNFDLHIHCADVPYPPPSTIHQNPTYPPFPNYPPQSASEIPNFTTYPAIPNTPFPTYITPPSALPAYPQSNFPAYPQPNPPPPIYTPSSPLVSTPPPPPNQSLPIYTPPNAAITVVAPPPTPPQPASSNPSPPPQKQKQPSLIKHFSHPHVLLQMEIEKENAKVCPACECELTGSAYCCTEGNCTFNLHKACFDSPQELRHKCHLEHPLNLLATPPYNDGFTCNACLKDGKGFVYHCATCSYDLHIDCVTWPETVTRPDHKHTLNLYYSSPAAAAASSDKEVVFMCDVCTNPVHEMAWVYYCRECDYGTHLECVASGLLPAANSDAGQTEDELLRETQLKFAVLQLLLSGGLSAKIN